MTKTTWAGLAAALTLGLGIWFWSANRKPPAPPPAAAPMLLLRHLEVTDLGRVYAGEPTSTLGPADVFVYGHDGIYEDQVTALVLDSLRVHRYFNVLQAPRPEWVNQGSVWFDFGWKTIHQRWGAIVRDSLGVPARFQYYGQTFVYDWSVIGRARADSIVAVQVASLGSAKDAYLDQFWTTPRDWFFFPGGPAFGDITPAEVQAWKVNILYYAEAMRKAVAAKGGTVIINGDPEAPPPIFLENGQWTWYWGSWRAVVERWRKHPGNVLSVDALDPDPRSLRNAPDSLLLAWTTRRGGTINLSGTLAQTQAFYDRAAKARAARAETSQ